MIEPKELADASQLGQLMAQSLHTANKLNDQNSVLQALQSDFRHITKAVDALVEIGKKQSELKSDLNRHSDSIDRAFRDMGIHKDEFTHAIKDLAEILKEERKSRETTAKEDRDARETAAGELSQFKGAIRALKYVAATVIALLIFVGGVIRAQINSDHDRTDAALSAHLSDFERRRLAVDIKIDALSQQVQEVRLSRERDLEAKEVKRP